MKVRMEVVAIIATVVVMSGVMYLSNNYPEFSNNFMAITSNMAYGVAVIAIGGFAVCLGLLAFHFFKYLVKK